jgi:hypothetical protein
MPCAATLRAKLGGEDAPDLHLRLFQARIAAIVALYADPARAEENEPAIRRRLRVRGCVAGAKA